MENRDQHVQSHGRIMVEGASDCTYHHPSVLVESLPGSLWSRQDSPEFSDLDLQAR